MAQRGVVVALLAVCLAGCHRLTLSDVGAQDHEAQFNYHYAPPFATARHTVAPARGLRWFPGRGTEPTKRACSDGLCSADGRWNFSTF